MPHHESMRVQRRCPRCGERDIWEAPDVADETWFQTVSMPAAWGHDGKPMGHLEVSACGACGLVEWHTAALGELVTDEDAGVALHDESVCRACSHDRVWRVERMRDVRSTMSSSARSAHTRGLTYSVRGKRDKADEPIPIPDAEGRAEPLGGKKQLRNLLSHGALHGRPVGHLEEYICARCGFTDFRAHGVEDARGEGKVVDHDCSACKHAYAIELPTYDLRAEGIQAKRVALARTDWGNTRADMVLRVCLACRHTDWLIANTASLGHEAHGVSRVEPPREEARGPYRAADRVADAPAPDAPAAPGEPPITLSSLLATMAGLSQSFWVAVAAISGAVALFVLIHPAASLVAVPPVALWRWNEQRKAPRARIDAPPLRIEETESITEEGEKEDPSKRTEKVN